MSAVMTWGFVQWFLAGCALLALVLLVWLVVDQERHRFDGGVRD
jgi:hypothetical protein